MTTSSKCPTPGKARYATRVGADVAARRVQIAVGRILNPYQCNPSCGWWHLSKKPSTVIPADAVADPETLARLTAMAGPDFHLLVAEEARERCALGERIAIRDPALLQRWRGALGALIHDVNEQLARGLNPDVEWRRKTTAFKDCLESRRAECAERRRASGEAEAAERHEEAEARKAERAAERRPPQGEANRLRAEAGQAAIGRLIQAHHPEFTRYLAEECQRVGGELPARVRRYLDQQDSPPHTTSPAPSAA
ncbi:hypothetical protein [Actinacidiphila sp. ITFR-21]|uniref:hypothetical protein n=1 Tax=Actinacidiphila sp. ITFR-21 TaxID=3075199 RepID=UPI00288C00A5|nr:hypothetical protein [Streptomyces sp. ITFR-21]WNI19150.1 hypothetical protein RLT57_28845 [Streptomyces sp. ITFR-21]